MKVGELKKRIEELGVSDDANVWIIQRTSFKDPVIYEPSHISKKPLGRFNKYHL